jgi:hypothetical protein
VLPSNVIGVPRVIMTHKTPCAKQVVRGLHLVFQQTYRTTYPRKKPHPNLKGSPFGVTDLQDVILYRNA